jgi:hypothetical protein
MRGFFTIAGLTTVCFRAVRAITREGRHTRAVRFLEPARRDGIAPNEALEPSGRGLEGGTLENARTV